MRHVYSNRDGHSALETPENVGNALQKGWQVSWVLNYHKEKEGEMSLLTKEVLKKK